MSDTLVPWDRVAGAIRSRLPEWAQYSGYSTYAIACYFYALLAGAIALSLWLGGVSVPATVAGVGAVLLYVFAGYYESAAKRRVTCAQCGAPAEGKSVCPACGQVTFVEGEA